MTKIGLDAVEAIKGLMSADAVLVAGDEQAAVESANRWLSGEGVSGRPYEGYSDACDLAWGGSRLAVGSPAHEASDHELFARVLHRAAAQLASV